MIGREARNLAGPVASVAITLLCITLVIILIYNTWPTAFDFSSTPGKGDIRIIQEIAIDKADDELYEITTRLQYFNGQWQTAKIWCKYNIAGHEIILTKRLQQHETEAYQKQLKRDLTNFYK